jgi:phage regulator Rha-like protein
MTHTHTQEKAAGAINANGLHTDTDVDFRTQALPAPATEPDITLITTTPDGRIDSRLLAQGFGNQRRAAMALIDKYLDRFEQFGKVRFKKAPLPGSKTGQSERYAELLEDHAYFLLSLTRNSDMVVDLKVKLIRAFAEYRQAADMRKNEYLPLHYQLHDALHALAAGSPKERFVHMNVNRLLNKFAGIESGQRAHADTPQQALLIVGLMVASQGTQGATDHHDGYQNIKTNLQALENLTLVGGAPWLKKAA